MGFDMTHLATAMECGYTSLTGVGWLGGQQRHDPPLRRLGSIGPRTVTAVFSVLAELFSRS
jgi:hypothetical protein